DSRSAGSGFSLDLRRSQGDPRRHGNRPVLRSPRETQPRDDGGNMKTTRCVRITALVALVAAVAGVVAAHGSASRHSARPRAGKVLARIQIPPNSGALAVGEGAVWATSDAVPTLLRIDPRTSSVVARVPIAAKKVCADLPGS